MPIDLVGISNRRSKFKYNKDNMGSLTEYRKIAEITVKQYGGKYTKEILGSEEAMSNIMTAIMMGDCRWDASRSKHSTQATYRINCARWEIKRYKKRSKANKPVVFSIHSNPSKYSSLEYSNVLASDELPDTLEISEQTEDLNALLDCGVITPRESAFIRGHYLDGKTLSVIAKENSISNQRVEQIIKKGMSKLQEIAQTV